MMMNIMNRFGCLFHEFEIMSLSHRSSLSLMYVYGCVLQALYAIDRKPHALRLQLS